MIFSDVELKRLIEQQQVMVTEFSRAFSEEVSKLRERVAHLEQTRASVTPAETVSRIEALELWRGKVHGLLIDQTPTGRERLTKTGKGVLGLLAQR